MGHFPNRRASAVVLEYGDDTDGSGCVLTFLHIFSLLDDRSSLIVYALYNRSPLIGFTLIFWFLLSRVVNVWNGIKALGDTELDALCIAKNTSSSSGWFM